MDEIAHTWPRERTPPRSDGGITVLYGVFVLLTILPLCNVGGQTTEPAVLDTRVSWGQSVPIFPANTARYFRGRYDLAEFSVDVYVIEDDGSSGLPAPGVPVSDDTGENRGVWETTSFCGSIDPVRYVFDRDDEDNMTMEAPVPQEGRAAGSRLSVSSSPYRLVFRVVSTADPETLCAFMGAFLELFEYFRVVDAERGRPLIFSGERTPEFPAVIELP